MQLILVGVNLDCIDAYAVLERVNDTKLHVFAPNGKHITWTFNLTWWLCPNLELITTDIYETKNWGNHS